MNLIKSFIGRRQFLIGSMASASALAFTRLVKSEGVALGADSTAGGASQPGGAGPVGGEGGGSPFIHLLSPLRVRNKVLKNRIMHTPAPPHALQGPENYPGDQIRSHYSNIAKNVGIVMITEMFGENAAVPEDWDKDLKNESGQLHHGKWEYTPLSQNYMDQLIEDIHCEGALVGGARVDVGGNIGEFTSVRENRISASRPIKESIAQAKKYEARGYDAVYVGSRELKNREEVRPVIEHMQAIREATDLIVVAWIRPYTPGLSRGTMDSITEPTGHLTWGPELEEVVAMAEMLEGAADILQMKDAGHYTCHPNSFTMDKDKPWMLKFSKAIKESGNKIVVCPTGGFHVPQMNDGFVADGSADMIGMVTPFIADPEYVKKLSEGRDDDIVPCVMCHDCHGISRTQGPWFDVCTVNPEWGLSETKKRSIHPPTAKRKVAVIGGGPAGMKAAITAAERGHNVTLYEKSDSLGGLIRHTDFTKYKWAQKDFKDYLVRQTSKSGVEVLLSTEANPDMIKAKGYDIILVATGAEPIVPNIPGANGKNVYDIVDVYSNLESLGKNVVLIGGGVYGTETGICLAKSGYKVTALTSEKYMIPDGFIGPHNKENQLDIIRTHENFNYILEAITTRISEGKVFYRDAKGSEKSVKADSVVIFAGLRPRMDEAIKFSGSGGQVLLIGDCTGEAGTIQKAIRSAYFMASQI